MNKKVNTALFLVGATVFQLLLWAGIAALLFFIATRLFGQVESPLMLPIVVLVSVVGGMVATFVGYNQILKLLMKKIDFPKYFDPIVSSRRR